MKGQTVDLYDSIPQIGRLEWIGVRPARRKEMVVVAEANLDIEVGLIGDRFNGKPGSKRMVTLVQAEHLPVIASILDLDEIDPARLRRNLVVSGINLLSLKAPGRDLVFSAGEAILQMTGNCHPCSRMEENLGPGGFNAMRGHGGITAKVIAGGEIRLGSQIRVLD